MSRMAFGSLVRTFFAGAVLGEAGGAVRKSMEQFAVFCALHRIQREGYGEVFHMLRIDFRAQCVSEVSPEIPVCWCIPDRGQIR